MGVFAFLVIFIGLTVLFVRSPWGQSILISKVVKYVSQKTGAEINVGRLFVTFSGDLVLEDLFISDAKGDTLLFSGYLETGVALRPLIQSGDIEVTKLEWNDLVANISRDKESGDFNFDFLLDPFLTDEEDEKAEPSLEKASESPFPSIKLPKISIQNVKLVYDDQWNGMYALLTWESFFLHAQTVDLNQMNFDLDKLSLSNAEIKYIQTKPFEVSEEEESSSLPLPLIALGNGNLSRVSIHYESIPDGILAEMFIGDFNLQLPEADLESQKVLVKSVSLENSRVDLALTTRDQPSEKQEQVEEPFDFQWPDWNVSLHYLGLLNSELSYSLDGQVVKSGYLNPEAIALKDLNLEMHALTLEPGKFGLQLDDLRFRQGSGLMISRLGLGVLLTEKSLDIDAIEFISGDSKLKSDISLSYASLNQWISNPLAMEFKVGIKDFGTSFRELSIADPSLLSEDWYRQIRGKLLAVKGTISGDERNVKVSNLSGSFDRDLRIAMKSGDFSNYLDIEQLYVSIQDASLSGTKSALEDFLTEDTEAYVPDNFELNLQGKGGLKDFEGNLEFKSTFGDAYMYLLSKEEDVWTINTQLELKEFQVNQFTETEGLAPISLQLEFDGEIKDLYHSKGNLKLVFDQLNWNGVDFSELDLSATLDEQLVVLSLSHPKDYLNLDLQVEAKVDTLKPEANLLLDLKNLDTQYLGLTSKALNVTFKSTGDFVFEGDELEAEVLVSDAFMRLQGQRSFPIGDIQLQVINSATQSQLILVSDFLNGQVKGNKGFESVSSSLSAYLGDLLETDKPDIESIEDVKVKANFQFNSTPFIDQLLISNVERIDSIHLGFAFDAKAKHLDGEFKIPHIQYGGLQVDSMLISMTGNGNELFTSLSFQSLETGPISMEETKFSAALQDRIINTNFISKQNEDIVIAIKSQFFWEGDTIIYKIDPENLTLNKRAWEIPVENAVKYAGGYLAFDHFNLSRNNQRFTLTNTDETIVDEHVALIVDNFDVNTVTSFLNPDNPFLKGRANGTIVIERPTADLGFLADFSIKDLVALDVPLGTLSLDADSKNLKEYEFKLLLKDGLIDGGIEGQLKSDEFASRLDVDLAIRSIDLKLMEILSGGEISESSGILSGQIKVSGTTSDIGYMGYLQTDQAKIKVASINAEYSFPNERIEIQRDFLEFKNFTMKDALGNDFRVNGKILTEDFSDIGLNLDLKTKGFQLLNSTRSDNDLFFGKANIDLDMKITGPLSLPKIDVQFMMNRGSEITFIVPEDQLDLQERDGVVLMVNRKDPYDMFYQRELDSYTQGAQGYDVRANIKVDPNFVFNLIVDERTGDNLKLQGEADLNLLMDPNGNISLSGKYEVRQGHYELNLFGLVNRRFLLGEGSSVTWTGNPLDANLNLKAIYNVRTSAAELMQAQLSGLDNSTRGQFRQVLPFMVYLKIDGELVSPQISFELDMPENERGVFGGNVYAAVTQLNEKEDELTKQVFALLVLNQFFPSMGNDGSTGGSVSLARSSVSQVLSTQLNALSDRLFGESGFSLDFDLDSFTDFQNGGPQDRTQLSVAAKQTLLDDRLVISIGGQVDVEGGDRGQVNQGDALFGDVSVEYLLDEMAQWRAKAFRRNQFESVIDGQLIVTGIALIFNKEFNAFAELWKKKSKEEDKKPDDKESVNEAQLKEEENE